MSSELELSGLDGGNPLAFLAALGTLRTLDAAWPQRGVKMNWRQIRGAWRPVVQCSERFNAEDLIAALQARLQTMRRHDAFSRFDNLKLQPADFRDYASAAVQAASAADRSWADFAASFACEATLNREGNVQDTALRTMSGAGHQDFIKFMRVLIENTDTENLRITLFEPWMYAEPGPSLRWDPCDDRRYALRWKEPSGDAITTMRGANRLAIEALAFLPTAPRGKALCTTGFRVGAGREALWTWPIWDAPLPVVVVRSLLALNELQQAEPDRMRLVARGITEVYRSQRLTIGKYRNFTPARAV